MATCIHHWIAPAALGPYPPDMVTEQCHKCKAKRQVCNHLRVKFRHGLKGHFDPALKAIRAEEVELRVIADSSLNHQGFHRSGPYHRLERLGTSR